MNSLDKYRKIRPLIRPGDLMAFKGNALISRIIRLVDTHSHVATVVSSPKIHAERVLIIEADQGEVNVRALSTKIKGYNGKVYLYRLSDDLWDYRDEIDRFMWDKIGVLYDFESLLANALGRVNANADKYFCSELCGSALLKGIGPNVLTDMYGTGEYIRDKFLRLLMAGKALRPGGIAALPVFEKPIKIVG